jgi:hypothetical protein
VLVAGQEFVAQVGQEFIDVLFLPFVFTLILINGKGLALQQ